MSKNIEKNLSYLKKFEDLAKIKPGPTPYSVHLGNPKASNKICIISAAHGNEVGSIPALIKTIKNIIDGKTLAKDLQIIFSLGNVEAIKKDQRYVEEDMNRAYGREEAKSIDAKRAKELEKIIQWADVFIDIHQTIEKTKGSFYVLRNDENSIALCQALALSEYAIIIDDKKAETKDRITGTSFALQNNTIAFTIELSEKGYFEEAEDLALKTIDKAIHFFSSNKVSEIKNAATKEKALILLDVSYAHKFANKKMHLIEGLENRAFYKKDTILGYDGENKILAPFDGYIFFPKYPKRNEKGEVTENLPTNLFMLAKEV